MQYSHSELKYLRPIVALRDQFRHDVISTMIGGRIKNFKKKYQRTSTKIIIVCNGPSLREIRLEKLQGTDTIGMNKIDLLYDKTDWRPSMVMAANEDIVRQGLPVFSKTSIPTFINSKFLTTRFFLANTKLLPTRYVTDVMLHFSQEIGHYYLGGTITYPAIQLAAQLGYKQIGIVGLDHHFPVMNASPDQRVRLDQDDDNHFDNTYFKGKTWQPPNLRMNELHYSFAKSHLTEKEITIVNCSTQSKLDVFQRHTLNTFLNGEA